MLATTDPLAPLLARRAAAAKYQPKKINLLLVAEAPPCDTDRYFYFEDVDKHDWLFRYVYQGLTGKKPTRENKAAHLAELRDAGVFMIDLHEENVSQPTKGQLEPRVADLIERCRKLKPRHVAFVKMIVHEVSAGPLRQAGLPVIDVPLPFPASGQQRKFLDGFKEVKKTAGL